jgi:diazepam-binding inhibitor (GABA receptor modulating acyl-CoA-binding protein)
MNLFIDITEINFSKAAEEVMKLKQKPTDEELLKLYGFYKQGKFGNNKTSKPSFFDFKSQSKWNSWNNLQGMGKNKAKIEYINFVESLKNKYN